MPELPDPLLPVFGPDDPLESAIRSGDCDATIACLLRLTPAERHSRRAGLRQLGERIQHSHWPASFYAKAWGAEANEAQYQAHYTALLACGRPEDFINGPDHYPGLDATAFAALCERFELDAAAWRARLQEQVRASLTKGGDIVAIQRLVAAGLIERPAGDDYVTALIGLPRRLHWQSPGGMPRLFQQDPGLHQAVLRFFEVQGSSENNLAAMDKYCSDPQRLWRNIFLQALSDGAYTRAQLLDKTLDTLESDWPQFRASWFSHFHQQLAPDPAEMAARAERYLGLCQSRIAPTVTLALQALKVLLDAGAVQAPALLAALRPVLSSSIKGQVEAALKLLDTVVRQDPSLAAQASELCSVALIHESAELQKKVLQRLAGWGMDDSTRLALAEHLPGIAAVHRPALLALVGDVPEAAPDTAVDARAAMTNPAPASIATPLDPDRALRPLDDADELLDRCAFVLENELALDDFERVAEALVRRAPFDAEVRKRFSPLVKRARRIRPDKPVTAELARLVLWVMQGERVESLALVHHREWSTRKPTSYTAEVYLGLRIDDWMELAALGAGVTPLSAATHRRGFVAPSVLVERAAAHAARGVQASPLEQVQSLLRLPPRPEAGWPDTLLRGARALPDTPFSRALRHALGDTVPIAALADPAPGGELERELFLAAARIRCPGADDAAVLAAYGDLGPDAGAAARFQWEVRAVPPNTDGPSTETFIHHFLVPSAQPSLLRPSPHGLARWRIPLSQPGQEAWQATWQFQYFSGSSEAMVMYAASLMPGSLEAFFAGGAGSIGNNLKWGEAQWKDNAYLRLLQDPTVPLSPMALLTLAVALCAKEPGLVALAVDVLVQSHAEGRLDAQALGDTLGRLLATPLVLASRYRKSLQAALRCDGRAAPLVFGLICDMLAAQADPPARDLAALLELLLELSLSLRRPLPGPCRDVLGRLPLGGKGRALQKALLQDAPA